MRRGFFRRLGATALLALAALRLSGESPRATRTPKRTPTPQARLGGGFGSLEVTPASPGAMGQTLADLVRAASDAKRRRATPRPAVSITNESLVTDPNRGKLTVAQPATRPTTSPRSAAAARGTPLAGPAPVATVSSDLPGEPPSPSEAEWRETARRARKRVEDDRERLTRLEGEVKKLESDFYAWDDGQYRDNVIKPAWDHKKEELDATRRDLAQAENDVAELPEKARKAGALPGWIRE
ncbi:MAG: hypothetical protein ABI968_13855 [Acidobacteriota bacterium]